MYTNTSTLLITSIKKVTAKTIRDFGELEKMLTSPKTAIDFAIACDNYVKETLYKDLSRIKKKYSVQINDTLIKGIDSSNKFIIHGIIGIDNFYRCIPYFCIAVSLERDNQIFATAIYNPISNEMFYAEKSVGSYFNNRKLNCYERIQKSLSYLALDKEALDKVDKDKYQGLWLSQCKVLDLCYLAASKVNNCLFLGTEKYYLLYPGIFLLKEAGFKVSYECNDDMSIITKVQYES